MPKDKERSFNPAMAQRKSDKQKALKKSKSEALNRRNEKLARRNPDRIQRQINNLKEVEESGRQLRPHDKELLEALERDFRSIQKAREALGDKAPVFGSARPQGHVGRDGNEHSVLGKRRRDDGRHRQWSKREESDSSDTDESVRGIPMPRDTPPPIPRDHLKRKNQGPHALPSKPNAPATEVKTVYEAAPDVRNLQEEAVSKFVPAAVRMKQQSMKGKGKLLEPEELDSLERAGYVAGQPGAEGETTRTAAKEGTAATAGGDDYIQQEQLRMEEERFNKELQSVQVEDVEDEEA